MIRAQRSGSKRARDKAVADFLEEKFRFQHGGVCAECNQPAAGEKPLEWEELILCSDKDVCRQRRGLS